MSKRITISPITRIVGMWRIDLEVDQGKVTDAKSSGMNLKGLELIVKGREPRDTPYLLARICGICAIPHMLAATTALENAWGIEVPLNAVLLRQLLFGAQLLQNHLRHFYLFTLPDFVKGPDYPPFTPRYNTDLRCNNSENKSLCKIIGDK